MASIHDKNGWLIGGDEVSVKVIWNRIKDEGPDWLKEFWPTAEGLLCYYEKWMRQSII